LGVSHGWVEVREVAARAGGDKGSRERWTRLL
jgi:hypothetical protein